MTINRDSRRHDLVSSIINEVSRVVIGKDELKELLLEKVTGPNTITSPSSSSMCMKAGISSSL